MNKPFFTALSLISLFLNTESRACSYNLDFTSLSGYSTEQNKEIEDGVSECFKEAGMTSAKGNASANLRVLINHQARTPVYDMPFNHRFPSGMEESYYSISIYGKTDSGKYIHMNKHFSKNGVTQNNVFGPYSAKLFKEKPKHPSVEKIIRIGCKMAKSVSCE